VRDFAIVIARQAAAVIHVHGAVVTQNRVALVRSGEGSS